MDAWPDCMSGIANVADSDTVEFMTGDCQSKKRVSLFEVKVFLSRAIHISQHCE